MKTLLREPLVHFLLLGVVMFAAYSLVSKRSSSEPVASSGAGAAWPCSGNSAG